MPARSVGVTDNANASGIAEVEVMERASPDITTPTTADPGAAGTSLAATLRDRFPQSGQFKVRVEDEIMLVTAGWGTGAGNFTVTRGQDGTTAVAHAIGSIIYYVFGVQRVEPVDASRLVTYAGRLQTFRTPGRAGTVGQKILAIHNATGSPVKVRVTKVFVDIAVTVIKAVTVLPPVIRVWKFTAVPTNGTALTKVPTNSAVLNSSNGSVTGWGDASADGTPSGTQLAVTLPASMFYTQEFAPRLITAAGYEMFDRETFLDGESEFIDCNALEGVCLFLDYTLATQNPTTDMWVAGLEWEEYRWS